MHEHFLQIHKFFPLNHIVWDLNFQSFENYLGLSIRLSVNDYAVDDKVIAVGVTGFESNNTKPHITLAVNRTNGGKPMMSNNLLNWEKLKRPLLITGKVTEVPYK